MNALTQASRLKLPCCRGAVNWLRCMTLLGLILTAGGPLVVKAQDTNSVSQTNDVAQADEAATDGTQNGDVLMEEADGGTNAVSNTNQITVPGPDGRARRQRRRVQNRARDGVANRAPASGAADTNRATGSLDYAAFRLVADRNIFDPNRAPRSTRPSAQPTKAAETFTLVGTLSYEKGNFAFFDGTSSDFKKAAKTNDLIAGYKIAAISTDSVKLEQSTNVLELAVGTQMRRRDDGSWARLAASESAAETAGSATSSVPSSADNDVLMKLKMRREKE